MSSSPTPDERNAALAQLLARVALGDRAAFSALYKAVSAQLLGVILRIQRDRAQAEDVLQEIFVSVWRAAQGFDATRAQPMTWLTSVARHRAIDSLRRAHAKVATVSTVGADSGDDDDGPSLVDTLPSPAGGPLEAVSQSSDARAVSRCIGTLSAEQQQCVALAYYQGLSHAEMAAHLRQPLGTVKSWVRRALLSLKACLGQAVVN